MATWGLSWTNGKILSEYCSSSILAFWRFFLSSIFMIPVLLVSKKSVKVNGEGLKYIIIGSIFIFSYNIFFFMGTNLGYANVGGVFVPTLNPIITFILSILFFRVKIFTKDSIGLVFGIIGMSRQLKVLSRIGFLIGLLETLILSFILLWVVVLGSGRFL